MLSLERIAVINIATTLWNHEAIIIYSKSVKHRVFYSGRNEDMWERVEDEVIGKVSKLPLPELLKIKVISFIKPIGLEILRWVLHYQTYLPDLRSFMEQYFITLRWTPEGCLNKKKTVEVLIQNNNIDIVCRYKLACIYCLEDDIPALWKKIPESHRKSIYSKNCPIFLGTQEYVITLWTYIINGEVAKMANAIDRHGFGGTVFKYAFENAANIGNLEATKYFLQKLNPEEREQSLIGIMKSIALKCMWSNKGTNEPKGQHVDVLLFLLSEVNEEQQIHVLKSYPGVILQSYLIWPRQHLFLKTASCMWNFLSHVDYYFMLLYIVEDKVMKYFKDFNYQKLFQEFWQQSPINHRRYVIGRCAGEDLLAKLLQVEDKENIKQILEDATVSELKNIIFSDRGKKTCENLIDWNKMDVLKFFIQQCISCKGTMIKFKEEFKDHICHRSKKTLQLVEDKWSKFFQLLDDLIKREEGNSILAKRLS